MDDKAQNRSTRRIGNKLAAGLLDTIRRDRVLILAATGISLAVAIAVANLMRPVWEAAALVRIGQLGGSLLESQERAVARMNVDLLANEVARAAEIPPERREDLVTLNRGILRAKPVRNSDFIEVRIRAYSRDEAIRILDAGIQRLSAEHDQQFVKPQREVLTQKHAVVVAELDRLKAERRIYEKQLKQIATSGGDTARILLLVNLADRHQARVSDLAVRKAESERSLETHPTRLASEIVTGSQPVAPRKTFIAFVGACVGFALGVVVAILRSRLHERQQRISARE